LYFNSNGSQFYDEGIAKSRSFSFKLHHNMIGPLYVIFSFFVFDVVMRNIFKKTKNENCVILAFEA